MEGQFLGSYHFRVMVALIIILRSTEQISASCADRLMGVENKYIIPDSSFTASSYYARSASDVRYIPSNGRLNAGNGWGPKTNDDPNDYLQIDLGYPYVICAVATQGRSSGGEWVEEYKIDLSLDNKNWPTYQENGTDKTFTGNTVHNTIVKHVINKPLARYIRFIPTANRGYKTMRVGIYGYKKACQSLPVGMQSGVIQDGNITASSSKHSAKNARLHYTLGSSWCASTSDSSPYLQIDLGSPHLICAVATQGNSLADQWVMTYQIKTSTNGTIWTTYQENNTNRIISGNYDRSTVVRQVLYYGIVTRYLRIVPKTYQTSTACLRTEIYGHPFQSGCSSLSVGIPSVTLVPDHRFTATTYYDYYSTYLPKKGRLGSNGAWLPQTQDRNDYLQIDLGDIFYICAVATQGYSSGEYVTKYKIQYSINNKTWTTYSKNVSEKEFNGNEDGSTVVANSITHPFQAKFVRVFPTKYHRYKSIRVDFKGLTAGCVSSLGLENSQIPDSKINSSSSSDNSHSASHGRLYGGSSWCSSTTSKTEYIQVDLGEVKTVTGIATQGDNSSNKWVTSYKVSYSFDNRFWNEYTEGQITKDFNGSTNKNGVIVNWLSRPIAGRYVRVLPQTGNGQHCLRFDLYGCALFVAPNISLDTANFTLPSIKGSSKTLTCIVLGQPTPDIQWFNNGTKINGATQPTLQVQFISAKDVVTKYNCTRHDPNTRVVVCNTFYTCRIVDPNHLPSGTIKEGTVNVTVNLNVPSSPTVSGNPDKRSIRLSWTKTIIADDVGAITWYIGEFNNQSSIMTYSVKYPTFTFDLTYLKPYTKYTVRMKAISIVGQGLWTRWLNVNTLIAEPEGIPVITKINASSSQSIELYIKFNRSDLLHGPMAGFRIFYKPEGGAQQHIDVGNVTMAKLNDLKKYTNYGISVSVRNTKYAGPASSVEQKSTLEDVPDIGPSKLQATKINETSYLVTWQPLTKDQSNGVVIKYEIKWQLVLDRLRSKRSAGNSFIDSAKSGNNFTLYNLEINKQYQVFVRAFTKVGPGPNSNFSFMTSSERKEREKSKKTAGLQMGPIIGPVVGIVLILTIVIVVIVVYRRRPNPLNGSNKQSTMPLENIENMKIENTNAVDDEIGEEQQKNEVVQVQGGASTSPNDRIYEEPLDDSVKPIPVRQFLEYVRSMKATDYARLKKEYNKLLNEHSFPKSAAKKPVNKKKNRYGNVIPYDHSRVVIKRTGEDEDSDYVNASYIRGFDETPKSYIASQGPVEETFADFWQMIWEQNTCTIVMLTKIKELGKIKCHKYWPDSRKTYRDIEVNNHKSEIYPDYTICTLLLTKMGSEETRRVLHFQFTVWPDKGVPQYATAVLGLRRKVKTLNPPDSGPLVIHCSAGIGRTGCYIVIDAMLERAKKLRNVDISNYVATIRKDRPNMVQTDEQYVFIHMAILETLSCGNTEIQAFNLQIMMNKLAKINPKKNTSGYVIEFQRLNSVTADYKEDDCDVGRSKENEAKNRDPQIVALNRSRVKLMRENTGRTDYINASFIHAYRERNAFIVTQAPLQNTIEDFWLMIVNYEIGTIVMLNTLQEDQEQFPQYWPHKGARTYGVVKVELQQQRDLGDIVARRLQVSHNSVCIQVQHLQHLKWPDKSIPAKPQSLITFLNEVEQSQRKANNAPVVVQCSNGVGRSGTFCAISSILERMKQEQVIDVFQVVKCIRSNRPGAVESLTQYVFCYQIIQKYLESFSDYANFSNC